MGKLAFPVRRMPLPVPDSCRKKWRESIAGVHVRYSPVALIAFLVFVLSRPYRGIIQDAHIYMGRALADLDPNGVGRDLMFVHDGQFGFSLFRIVADAMVWCLGLAAAAKSLAILAALAWFFAARAFARQFASGTAVWVAVIFAALLPNAYGAPYPLGFAELIAIPRPFAEALVLAGLAAFAANRAGIALMFIAAAALLHPIMALAGCAAVLAVLGWEDKRWFWLFALGGALSLWAGWLGMPLLDRLFIVVDPSLKSLHESRSPFLFPSLWPAESFPPLIVQATSLVITAHAQQGRRRTILAAILVVGLGGIAMAAMFGDWFSSLLIVQAQPWRMAWLMAVAAAMAFGICAVDLWRAGPSARIVLALLVLCWSFETQFAVAGPAAMLALLLHFRTGRFAPLVTPRRAATVWIFVLGMSAIWQLRLYAYLWHFAMTVPTGYGNPELVLIRGFLVLPLCVLTVWFAIAKPRIHPFLTGAGIAILLTAALVFWDHRTPAQRMMEESRPPPDIATFLDQRPGEVLWIDGLAETWFVLGRPQWASPLQGVPIIFSDVLAAEWRRRMQLLMDIRLADQKGFAPWSEPLSADRARLSQDSVRGLCARPDAPAWIIAPLELGAPPAPGIDMKRWTLPQPQSQMIKADGDYTWRQIDALGAILCRKP
ncbi:hypothetical protein QEV83_10275 [Methylocapsa sp. D3K7]|uniref:hypothetical protein n=1 Tax=Methylocapsa sp. D3K7 TaxID=3041435 RepID=UPI00244EFC25|nr:hypothetical protein [Methylocapsa sp. D3K7]WGJ13119.1 hypothetical protein QEV83_10275 [Methylocapsa sp. D3K7]